MARIRVVQLGALLVLLMAARGPFTLTLHAGTCGDGTCDFPAEDRGTCPEDCEPSCGNSVCDPWEDGGSCPQDCGYSGDRVCDGAHGENTSTCAEDCLICDGSCTSGDTCQACFGINYQCFGGECAQEGDVCSDFFESCGHNFDAPCCPGSYCGAGNVCWPVI